MVIETSALEIKWNLIWPKEKKTHTLMQIIIEWNIIKYFTVFNTVVHSKWYYSNAWSPEGVQSSIWIWRLYKRVVFECAVCVRIEFSLFFPDIKLYTLYLEFNVSVVTLAVVLHLNTASVISCHLKSFISFSIHDDSMWISLFHFLRKKKIDTKTLFFFRVLFYYFCHRYHPPKSQYPRKHVFINNMTGWIISC